MFHKDSRDNRDRRDDREQQMERKMISIRRVSKVTSQGKRLRFSAMVVCGDRAGKVGIGLGRGADTKSAVEKGAHRAEKTMQRVQLIGDTIPHEVDFKYGAARVILRPAKPGTGIIAGASARSVLELTGIENVYAKQIGSADHIANAYCTYKALLSLRSERVLAKMDNMKSRIAYKEQLDVERKKKDDKKRAEKKKAYFEKKKEMRGQRFGGGRRNDRFQRHDAQPKPEVKVETKAEAPKVEAPAVEVKTEEKKS